MKIPPILTKICFQEIIGKHINKRDALATIEVI